MKSSSPVPGFATGYGQQHKGGKAEIEAKQKLKFNFREGLGGSVTGFQDPKRSDF
jgi:hypothetical protein